MTPSCAARSDLVTVVVITPPAAPCVSLALAKAHLRVDGDDEDTLIGQHIAAAQGAIDGPAGWLNRAIGRQTLELRCDGFRSAVREISLPCTPLVEVASIAYLDAGLQDQVLAPGLWRATTYGLQPAWGQAWPCGAVAPEALRIRYTAGYADGQAPAPIRQALLLMIGDLFANREAVVIEAGKTSAVLNPAADALLAPFRWWTA